MCLSELLGLFEQLGLPSNVIKIYDTYPLKFNEPQRTVTEHLPKCTYNSITTRIMRSPSHSIHPSNTKPNISNASHGKLRDICSITHKRQDQQRVKYSAASPSVQLNQLPCRNESCTITETDHSVAAAVWRDFPLCHFSR